MYRTLQQQQNTIIKKMFWCTLYKQNSTRYVLVFYISLCPFIIPSPNQAELFHDYSLCIYLRFMRGLYIFIYTETHTLLYIHILCDYIHWVCVTEFWMENTYTNVHTWVWTERIRIAWMSRIKKKPIQLQKTHWKKNRRIWNSNEVFCWQ